MHGSPSNYPRHGGRDEYVQESIEKDGSTGMEVNSYGDDRMVEIPMEESDVEIDHEDEVDRDRKVVKRPIK